MKKELRILILEDVPTDVELIGHELRKRGMVFTSRHVETREVYRNTFLRLIEEELL